MEIIHRALRHRQGSAQVETVRGEVVLSEAFQHITSSSPAMQKTLAMASRAAASDATILVFGETGVGKEVVARAVHQGSSRRSGPFVAVNCGAFAEGVLESELFGHEKGAFTGADSRHTGKLEEADGGSLFLDELGDITPALQIRLLRVLQEGEFQRVGGNDTLRTDARVIGATHGDLEALVKQGGFREDLYYRLNVVSLTVPSLRERREDIPGLMADFLAVFAQRNGKSITTFSREASEALIQHPYPGNVRELENAVERAVVMSSEDEIRLEDLPESVRTSRLNRSQRIAPGSLPDQLDRMEKEAIIEALEKSDGVQSRAARLLGINERNLRYKLKKYGLK
jgi:two-component system NtrC family response regulator